MADNEWSPKPAALREGETADDSHAARNAALLAELERTTAKTDGGTADAELVECERCGARGLEERIEEHDCESFLERKNWEKGS